MPCFISSEGVWQARSDHAQTILAIDGRLSASHGLAVDSVTPASAPLFHR